MLPPNLVLSNNTILTSTYIKPGIRPNFAIIFFYGMMTFLHLVIFVIVDYELPDYLHFPEC